MSHFGGLVCLQER